MKRLKYVLPSVLLLLVLLALIVWLLTKCPKYSLSWRVVSGGGATFCTGESYTLGSTIGQPAADLLTGDGYTLTGGFWSAAR
jgi:hypothetical protein